MKLGHVTYYSLSSLPFSSLSLSPFPPSLSLSLPPSFPFSDDSEGVTLRQFTHALALWYVATEEASSHANQRHHVLPGTLRQTLIDALSYLEERHVRSKAGLKAYTAGKPH